MGQGVEGFEIERIGDGDGECEAVILDGNHAVTLGAFLGNGLDDDRIKSDVRKPDKGDGCIGGEGLGDVLLGEVGVGKEVLDDGFRAGERASGAVNFIVTHHAGFGEQFCEIIFVGKHWAWSP